MKNILSPIQIILAPNEDGFGTSAWAVGLAKEFKRQAPSARITVLVATQKRWQFHEDKYPPGSGIDLVQLQDRNGQPLPQPIELVKQSGAVDVTATLTHCVAPYLTYRKAYQNALTSNHAELLDRAHLLIDFGVPPIVYTAALANKDRKRRGEQEAVVLTLMDHAWSYSLSQIAAGGNDPTGLASLQKTLTAIRNDEALTQEVVLFGLPICPSLFHDYWQALLHQSPQVIPGCLGGPLRTLAFAQDPEVAGLYNHWPPAKVETEITVLGRARSYARQLLGLNDLLPCLLITGGGSPVWDGVLERLVNSYLNHPPPYQVVVYSPVEVARQGIRLAAHSLDLNGVARTVYRKSLGPAHRLTFIDQVAGETHHILFPAFDLVLTRAGGGTVNDALAFRVPLILVEEYGMWQVEQIRRACLNMGLAEGITLADFKQYGRQCVETDRGTLKCLSAQRHSVSRLTHHAEIWLCRYLLKRVAKQACILKDSQPALGHGTP